jgi:hypothetical protein
MVSATEFKLTPWADAIRRKAWLVAKLVGVFVWVDAGPGLLMIFSLNKFNEGWPKPPRFF